MLSVKTYNNNSYLMYDSIDNRYDFYSVFFSVNFSSLNAVNDLN